ncbi:hypothetical protein [Aliikangiella sp. IMCC44359]|uniref:hypothetical protein n=1 Tax=Aliikangiella sp. IMCC44359 TaxID=3459125 RepID=UPI00403AB523
MKAKQLRKEIDTFGDKIEAILTQPTTMEQSIKNLEDSINQFTDTKLTQVLIGISQLKNSSRLLKEIAAHSYQHGNGFFKLVILDKNGYKLRLHIWSNGNVGKETIHNHRWWFASRVVAGHIESEMWELGGVNDVKLQSLLYFSGEKYGQKPIALGTAQLYKKHIIKHTSGDSYFLPPDKLHAIVGTSKGVTATLMVTTHPCRTFNEMYTNQNIDVTKQKSTPEEVKKAILSLLAVIK